MAVVSPLLAAIGVAIGYTFGTMLWLSYILGACGAFVYCITALLLVFMYASRPHQVRLSACIFFVNYLSIHDHSVFMCL